MDQSKQRLLVFSGIQPSGLLHLGNYLGPIRKRYLELVADPAELTRILAFGAQRAAAVAEPRLAQDKHKIGLVAPMQFPPRL